MYHTDELGRSTSPVFLKPFSCKDFLTAKRMHVEHLVMSLVLKHLNVTGNLFPYFVLQNKLV